MKFDISRQGPSYILKGGISSKRQITFTYFRWCMENDDLIYAELKIAFSSTIYRPIKNNAIFILTSIPDIEAELPTHSKS